MTDEELHKAGLIKAVLWLTPLETRVVRAALDAIRSHADEGLLLNEIQTRQNVKGPTSPMPTHRPKK